MGSCEHNVGYYDAFKLEKHRKDFDANVTRLARKGRRHRSLYGEREAKALQIHTKMARARKKTASTPGESCFWGGLEELHNLSGDNQDHRAVNKEKKRALNLQGQVGKWIEDRVLGKDVLKSSTFKAWWSELPVDLKTETISGLMNG
ncbi:senescence-associated carboxylesterase 101-like [Pyrus ussuriensis x Pyrus communis]|uniref:Senescence-associated carboxylesterase 101-like n=1 Tax=Pyrus ussuriensis x Pyrus communis TaxID=2448454 RepID=A0A5N5I2S1_9ROSA|nr:senescence-associated carboxylesterase 101-like [Pyrus ussuriensis x Pyrus communis]